MIISLYHRRPLRTYNMLFTEKLSQSLRPAFGNLYLVVIPFQPACINGISGMICQAIDSFLLQLRKPDQCRDFTLFRCFKPAFPTFNSFVVICYCIQLNHFFLHCITDCHCFMCGDNVVKGILLRRLQMVLVCQQRPSGLFQLAVLEPFRHFLLTECLGCFRIGAAVCLHFNSSAAALCFLASSNRTTPRTSRPYWACIWYLS